MSPLAYFQIEERYRREKCLFDELWLTIENGGNRVEKVDFFDEDLRGESRREIFSIQKDIALGDGMTGELINLGPGKRTINKNMFPI